MKPPCMIIVANILPVIRALVAKRLMEKHNFKLVEIAKKMNITPSAITQYMKGYRGGKILKEIEENKILEDAVIAITDELSKDEVNMENVLGKVCEACKLLRKEKVLCEMHISEVPNLKSSGCKLCLLSS